MFQSAIKDRLCAWLQNHRVSFY